MFIYLLLAAGLFMGWSLGTNDAANAFGTAVATRVVLEERDLNLKFCGSRNQRLLSKDDRAKL